MERTYRYLSVVVDLVTEYFLNLLEVSCSILKGL